MMDDGMNVLSIEEYNQLPRCPSCTAVQPTFALMVNGGYCLNCAIANGQRYTQSTPYELPPYVIEGIAIVCVVCGSQDPEITKYGEEYQVFCEDCSPLSVEEE